MKIRTLLIAKRKISKIGTYGQNEDKDSYNCKKKDRHIWKDIPSKKKNITIHKKFKLLPPLSFPRKRNKLN